MLRWSHFAGTVAIALVAVLASLAPAYGWECVKSSNGVVVSREASDATTTVNVRIYCDYKGGDTWNSAYPVGDTANYNRYVNLGNAVLAGVDAFEVPLVSDGGRVQAVYLGNISAPKVLQVLYEPVRVSVVGTPTVSVADAVSVVGGGVSEAADAALVGLPMYLGFIVFVAAMLAGLAVARGH